MIDILIRANHTVGRPYDITMYYVIQINGSTMNCLGSIPLEDIKGFEINTTYNIDFYNVFEYDNKSTSSLRLKKKKNNKFEFIDFVLTME